MDPEQTQNTVAVTDLKEKIVEVLRQRNFTYGALASYLGVTETELDYALETNTVEIRTLELISKELRIPLYSFFRDVYLSEEMHDKSPYYNMSIWSGGETQLRMEVRSLLREVEMLRTELRSKDMLIQALEDQLKKSI